MADSCCIIKKKSEDQVASSGDDKKTILFVPLDCVGHVNSLISIANSLRLRGHRTVFLFLDPMDGGLKKAGHEVYDTTTDGLEPSNPGPQSELKWDAIVGEMSKFWRLTNIDNYEFTTKIGLGSMMKDIMAKDDIVARKLELIKPDFIIIDHYFIQPALLKYKKPWARVYSASPIALHPIEDKLPPALMGLPTNWLDVEDEKLKEEYLELNKRVEDIKKDLYDEWNKYLVEEHQIESCPDNPRGGMPMSPYLNVYMYPEELDYDPKLERWLRCDSILRINGKIPETEEDNATELQVADFKIPDELKDKPGKLIFLSMGSLASGDVELMKKLIAILAKSPNRFIVSRGLNWDKYELADNMWGEKFIDQLAVLSKIDLIITHGGNNTITECFYFGVPGFVVCPVFSDQHDNAQRIEECKLGKRVDPFHCNEDQLLTAIEEVLADQSIRPRMQAIKERMQKPENKFKAIRLFADFIEGS